MSHCPEWTLESRSKIGDNPSRERSLYTQSGEIGLEILACENLRAILNVATLYCCQWWLSRTPEYLLDSHVVHAACVPLREKRLHCVDLHVCKLALCPLARRARLCQGQKDSANGRKYTGKLNRGVDKGRAIDDLVTQHKTEALGAVELLERNTQPRDSLVVSLSVFDSCRVQPLHEQIAV